MKAMSVWQPWASLLVEGLKDVENRGWRTRYFGRVVIHAGKRHDPDSWSAARALVAELGLRWPDGLTEELGPYGVLLGTVAIVDYARSDLCRSPWANNEPGGWCWVVNDPRVFARPIPFRGAQGLFDVPPRVLVDARGFRGPA